MPSTPEKTPRKLYEECWRDGRAKDATHFFVVHDPATKETYPVYVTRHEDPEAVRRTYQKPCKVSEIYNLDQPIEPQLNRTAVLP